MSSFELQGLLKRHPFLLKSFRFYLVRGDDCDALLLDVLVFFLCQEWIISPPHFTIVGGHPIDRTDSRLKNTHPAVCTIIWSREIHLSHPIDCTYNRPHDDYSLVVNCMHSLGEMMRMSIEFCFFDMCGVFRENIPHKMSK